MRNLSKPSSYLEASKKEQPQRFFFKKREKKNEMNLFLNIFYSFSLCF
tara:strand:+ start:2681 stop:2824 length:144 start_codon:yes stop_codon:yes gene_type:complete